MRERSSLVWALGGTMIVMDGKADLDPGVQAWLARSSGVVDRVIVVDSVHGFSPALERAIGDAVSGPLSYQTAPLPSVA